MQPYYEADGITIYHGDCRDILPTLEAGSVDLVLTDPPYGIAYNREDDPQSKHIYHHGRQLTTVEGDEKPFDPRHLLNVTSKAILWGANCYADKLPVAFSWLAWDKATRNGLNLRIAEFELAWTNCIGRSQMFRHLWSGAYRDSERDVFVHPTQKPVALMTWCLGIAKARSVIDPYCGSGSTLAAAKRLGIPAIGIEIEERYCEIAARRLSQGVLPLEVMA